jgi:small subunit ribosomal protein S6
MNKYELTIVLDGKATSAKKKAVMETLEKSLGLGEGKFGKVEDWGVKDLSYPIKKLTSGLFIHIPVEMPAESAKKLTDKIKTENDIIRYLLVRSEK